MEVALSLHFGNEFFLFQMAGCLAELVFRCLLLGSISEIEPEFIIFGASCK